MPLLLTFATFGVGFLARPVGGLVIGRFADAASFLVEWAPERRRGLFGSFHITTIFVGTVFGSALIALLNSVLGEDVMSDWGFQLPFAFGAVIALVALPFRTRTEETPLFVEQQEKEPVAPAPTEVLDRRTLVIKLVHTFFLVGMQSAAVYTFTSYLPSFLTKYDVVGGHAVTAGEALWSNTLASLAVIAVVVSSGAASDRFGRKPAVLVDLFPRRIRVTGLTRSTTSRPPASAASRPSSRRRSSPPPGPPQRPGSGWSPPPSSRRSPRW